MNRNIHDIFHKIVLGTTMLLALCGSVVTQAADSQDSIWTRDKLFGDGGGVRTKLGEHGIAVDLRLSQFYQSVEDGGVNENDEYGGKVNYIVNVDGHKAGLWEGLFLHLHAETRFGHSVLGDAGPLSIVNSAMLYPTPTEQSTEVTGWSVTQGVYQKGDTAVVLTAGKIHVVDLLNQVWPSLEMGSNGFQNYNVNFTLAPFARYLQLAHLGTGVMMLHKQQVKAAVIVLDTHNASTNTGFSKLGDNGLTLLGLYRFFFDIKDMPGNLTFIAGTSTGSYTTLEKTIYEVPVTAPLGRRTFIFNIPGLAVESERGPWTGLATYEQIVWQAGAKGERNVRFYAAGALADQNPSFANWQFAGHVVATGLFESRPLDKFGIGGYYTDLNSRAKDIAQNSLLLPDINDYSGLELFYSAAITPAVHLTGDMQIVDNPVVAHDTAIVPGIRLVVDF